MVMMTDIGVANTKLGVNLDSINSLVQFFDTRDVEYIDTYCIVCVYLLRPFITDSYIVNFFFFSGTNNQELFMRSIPRHYSKRVRQHELTPDKVPVVLMHVCMCIVQSIHCINQLPQNR